MMVSMRNAKTKAPGEIVFVSNCMQVIRAKVIYNAQPDHQPSVMGACPPGDLNPLDIWRRAHYEAGAWVLYAMPAGWRDAVLVFWLWKPLPQQEGFD